MICKVTLAREFFLGVGMTAFMCLAPQDFLVYTLALFVGMFTIYETFPEFHWVPAWTVYKIVAKEEDMAQGALRLLTQFLAATISAVISYQLLAFDAAVAYPTFSHEDDWRALLWTALIFGCWLALTNHSGQQAKGSFRRNLALTLTFCSANWLLQGIQSDGILNSAVNFGRTIGAKVYADRKEEMEAPELKKLWITICGPLLGVAFAYLALLVDTTFEGWAAPAADGEETTAIYGSTGHKESEPRGVDLELSVDKSGAAGDAKASEEA